MQRPLSRHSDNLTVNLSSISSNAARSVADNCRKDAKGSRMVRYETNDRIPTNNEQRVDERSGKSGSESEDVTATVSARSRTIEIFEL